MGAKTLLATAVTAALLIVPAAHAVDGSSVVKGNIVTQSGNDLTGATITLKHRSKGLVYTIISNAKGDYLLRNVPVGTYDVTIVKDGYQTMTEENVAVTIGQSIILDVQLFKAGTDIERIAVTGSAIRRVDMASSTSGLTFSSSELKAMPVIRVLRVLRYLHQVPRLQVALILKALLVLVAHQQLKMATILMA